MTTPPMHEHAHDAAHGHAATAAAPQPILGEALVARAAAVRDEVAKAFIGQDDVLDQILIVLLAGGHVLIEGVPGLGKTLLVRALGQALGIRSGVNCTRP